MKIVINPKNFKELYLKYLNISFGNWGNIKDYQWAFERTHNGRKADIIVIYNNENKVIAGSAISYRTIQLNDKTSFEIGIMTGSWTLPEARGKGCFSQIIQTSKAICTKNNIAFLTAFVMKSNASYRRLASAGAKLIETNHFISKGSPYKNAICTAIKTIPITETEITVLYNKLSQENYPFFSYSITEFKLQYFERKNKPYLLNVNKRTFLLEENDTIIKVLFFSQEREVSLINDLKCLINWSISNSSKKLLFFASNHKLSKVFKALELEQKESYFTIIPTVENNISFNEAFINLGDKM